MPDRALAHMFGGVADFIKTRRGLQQNTEDREMRQAEFDSGQEARRVATEGGRLSNDEARARAARQPLVDADTEFDAAIRRMGGIQNLTPDYFTKWAGADPARQSQIPALMKAAEESGARVARQDKRDQIQTDSAQMQYDVASLQKPKVEQEAKNHREANEWVINHPEAKPLEDDYAARMYALAGIPVAPSYARTRRDQLAMVYAGKHDYGAAEDARIAAQDRRRAQSLPQGVDIKTASIFDVLSAPLINNINVSMANIEKMKRDYTPTDKTGIAASMEKTGTGQSAAAKANQDELIRVSDALHLEADSVISQMRKAGVPAGSAGEEWARAQLRQYLTTVPKFWEGKIVGGARTGVAGPATTQTTGGQLSNQGR